MLVLIYKNNLDHLLTQKTLTTDVARVLRLIVKFRIMSCLIVT